MATNPLVEETQVPAVSETHSQLVISHHQPKIHSHSQTQGAPPLGLHSSSKAAKQHKHDSLAELWLSRQFVNASKGNLLALTA